MSTVGYWDTYLGYQARQEEFEDIINTIIDEARKGNTNFTLDLAGNYTSSEIAYIENEVARRLS
jgi:hypothetical protein